MTADLTSRCGSAHRVPIGSRSRRGIAAAKRAAVGGRCPGRAGLFGAERPPAHEPAARVAERLGRQPALAAPDEGEGGPLVLRLRRERREDLAAEPARPDAVARIAGSVVDAGSRHGAVPRQPVRGDVDRPAPAGSDASPRRGREAGRAAPARPGAAPGRRRASRGRRARRSRAGPTRCPSAPGRPASFGSSAGTCARRRSPRRLSSRSPRAAPAPAR